MQMRSLKFQLSQELIDAQEEVQQEEKVTTSCVARRQNKTKGILI
jgi:hypothetical protein